ncbi:MAG: Lrp/AsnC family transcriptional regulator [Candidatus Ranarchaeia archaeon]
MTRAMDKKDIEILKVLLKNGRATNKELANKVKLSVPTVFNRIKGMERRGIIKNFTVNIDHSKVGYPISAMIGVIVEPRYVSKAAAEFIKHPRIAAVHEVTGRFDLLLEVYARNPEELHRIRMTETAQIKGLVRTETMICMFSNRKSYF